MPTFVLYIKADVENVQEIRFSPEYDWILDVQEAAGSMVKESVHVMSTEENEISGSKGTANLVMRFEKGAKECTCSVMQVKGLTRNFTGEDAENRKWVPIIAFECRGMEPIKWRPEGEGCTVVSTGGTKFEGADLSEDYADYDDAKDLSISVMNLEHKFELAKGV